MATAASSAIFVAAQTSRHPTPPAQGPRGLEWGPRIGPPRGYFGRNLRKPLETAQPLRQKAIQDLLSRSRWLWTTSIFHRFLADLNRALSALFFNIGPQKIENPPSPGGPLGLQMSNVGLRGSKEGSRGLPEGSAGSGGCSAMLGDCFEILEKLLRNSGAWASNLDLGQAI